MSDNGTLRRARRPQLDDVIGRLDAMIDGLAGAIPAAVADALREALPAAVAAAVREALAGRGAPAPRPRTDRWAKVRAAARDLRAAVGRLVSWVRHTTAAAVRREAGRVNEALAGGRRAIGPVLVGLLVGRAVVGRLRYAPQTAAGAAAVGVGAGAGSYLLGPVASAAAVGLGAAVLALAALWAVPVARAIVGR